MSKFLGLGENAKARYKKSTYVAVIRLKAFACSLSLILNLRANVCKQCEFVREVVQSSIGARRCLFIFQIQCHRVPPNTPKELITLLTHFTVSPNLHNFSILIEPAPVLSLLRKFYGGTS